MCVRASCHHVHGNAPSRNTTSSVLLPSVMAAAGVGAATARPPPEAPSSYPARGDPSPAPQLLTGRDVRHAARSKTWTAPTAGLAPGFLQANLIVLPARYAADFRLLCARNPVPCPLVAESAGPGVYDAVRSHVRTLSAARLLSNDCDLRADAPRYMVYRDAALVRAGCTDVQDEWRDDHIAFLIGCSYSFEGALAAAGLPARHAVQARNVPMYRTSVPLCPAGVFVNSTYVVSMRPYKAAELDRVRDITRGYNDTRTGALLSPPNPPSSRTPPALHLGWLFPFPPTAIL